MLNCQGRYYQHSSLRTNDRVLAVRSLVSHLWYEHLVRCIDRLALNYSCPPGAITSTIQESLCTLLVPTVSFVVLQIAISPCMIFEAIIGHHSTLTAALYL
jgi:hypothetical protein